ncbi:MAG: 2-C-methyl-D-erythritol 4-phosphate cytidylyltransferase [Melioribacteraceae bacterium]|nr:2-C-methyl-D-erythritol 4-phosphate cytidylyltransferase [Melioribacteraceae bacterium]
MKTYAIIPSGGLGKRANSNLPKQYIKFNNKELIAYTLQVFQSSNLIDEIIVSAKNSYFELLETIKKNFEISKLNLLVEGGDERQDSVFNALRAINANDDDLIVVHDAVRPLITKELIYDAVQTAHDFGAAVVAIKSKDTLLKGNEFVTQYLDRSDVYYVQTPQVFKYKIIKEAFKKAKEDNFVGTDESMLVHRIGYEIKIVKGSYINFKVTTDEDIRLLSMILKSFK